MVEVEFDGVGSVMFLYDDMVVECKVYFGDVVVGG